MGKWRRSRVLASRSGEHMRSGISQQGDAARRLVGFIKPTKKF